MTRYVRSSAFPMIANLPSIGNRSCRKFPTSYRRRMLREFENLNAVSSRDRYGFVAYRGDEARIPTRVPAAVGGIASIGNRSFRISRRTKTFSPPITPRHRATCVTSIFPDPIRVPRLRRRKSGIRLAAAVYDAFDRAPYRIFPFVNFGGHAFPSPVSKNCGGDLTKSCRRVSRR